MVYPEFIKREDTIGVTACSKGCVDIYEKRALYSEEFFKSEGFNINFTNDVFTYNDGRSADKRERAREFNSLISDKKIKAIMMACGGDYMAEMLPFVDYEKIVENPKWIEGYSDPTGLLFCLTTKYDIATIYGNNFLDFCSDPADKSLYDNISLMKGSLTKQQSYEYYQDGFRKWITGREPLSKDKAVAWYSARGESIINMSGRMIGGCMDVLLDMLGTPYENVKGFTNKYKEDGIIWAIEPFALPAERLTIGLWKMKEAGWFENAKGFIFGRPAFYDETVKPMKDAVLEAIDELKLPIVCGVDIGHKKPSISFVMGAMTEIKMKNRGGEIRQFYI